MLLARFALFLAVATLALADDATLSTTSTPSTPSTPPPLASSSTDALPSNTTAPLCTCLFNDKRQLTELVCAASDNLEDENVFELGTILRTNCTYVLVEVVNHNVQSIDANTFAENPQLQYVHLYSDFIEQIDGEAFRVLTMLVEVDLSDNSLLTVDPRLFVDNSLLKSVSLADNPLIELKTNAPILESASITSLDLSMCKLSSLSVESFSKLPSLQRLDLSSNNIQQLPVTALQPLPQLNALIIANNRWRCDCAFKEVVDFARTMEETDPRVRCFGADRILESWTTKTAEKYCPDQDDYNSSSEEYDEDYFNDDSKTVVEVADQEETDLMEISSDLRKDTNDLRQEMSALLVEDTEVTGADETPDDDEEDDEVIIVVEGDDFDDEVDIFPVTVLVFLLTAFVVFAIGVSIVGCRALMRWYSGGRNGFRQLNDEGEGEVNAKVPF